MCQAVDEHLAKEEQILFPMIRAGRGHLAHMPVRVMIQEHDDHAANLARTRELARRLRVAGVRLHELALLYDGLLALELELMEHIHLENNVLFPAVLNVRERLAGVWIHGDRVKIGRSLFDAKRGKTMTIERHSVARSQLGLAFSVVVGVSRCLLLFGAIGCERQRAPSDTAKTAASARPAPISWTHFDVPAEPPLTPELLAKGKEVFAQNCASCHGVSGAGDGTCAPFLIPHPRDFTKSIFRFKTTPGGALPTDQDLFRTVSLGLHATGMPPWRYLLTDADRWAAVQYVKTLAPAYENHRAGTPVDIGREPEDLTPERVARGKQLYDDAGCASCHGAEGYGDGQSADTLKDAFGSPIQPRNFHKAAEFKRGHTLRDIALTISTGNNGTPMPSFGEVLEPQQLWDLATYVMGLDEREACRRRHAGRRQHRRAAGQARCRRQAHGARLALPAQ